MFRPLHLLPLIAILSASCSRYLQGGLTRDDAAKQLNNWQSLVIRQVVITDEQFQCGLKSGLWQYAGGPQSHAYIVSTTKGYAAGFIRNPEPGFDRDSKHLPPHPYFYIAKLQAEYSNTVTGIADADTPSTKLVEYVWKLDGAWPNRYANQALKDCFPDGSIQGKDKATFRHFDDGWRLMGLEGQYLSR